MDELPDYLKAQAADPQWARTTKVHDWRNHVPEDVRALWSTFTPSQQLALVGWANGLADREHWD